MQEKFTEEELNDMSEAEREALKDDVVDDDEGEEKDQDDLEQEEEQDNADTDEGEEEEEEEETPPKEEVSDPEPEPETEETQEEESQEEEKPSRLDEIKDELSSLKEKRDDGDIDYSEYEGQKDALDEEKQKLTIKEEVDKQVFEQRQIDLHNLEVQKFKDLYDPLYNKEGFEKLKDDKKFDIYFRGKIADVLGTKEGAGKDYRWGIDKAIENEQKYNPSFGKTHVKDNPNPKPGKKSKSDVVIPKTLSDLPSSEANIGDEFAHLDKLDGIEIEEALSKMPQEQADRYLEGTGA